MEYDDTKTPGQLADDARQTGRDAADAAQAFATNTASVASHAAHSIRSVAQDAKAAGNKALDDAAEVADEAKTVATDAARTGRAYARAAVNSTGRKMVDWKERVANANESCARFVADEPVKALWITAIASSLLTALAMTALRGSRRYDDYGC
ncbi:hypothetical protein [Variovorax sp. dw_308]|uniref:hypothetical protein n=1 Tax=Variovorax sp. dw_308 TaxID=2721546 RepID=UPI001C44A7C6|nr:hypothetical protein [Variovorax sp. dw_308]